MDRVAGGGVPRPHAAGRAARRRVPGAQNRRRRTSSARRCPMLQAAIAAGEQRRPARARPPEQHRAVRATRPVRGCTISAAWRTWRVAAYHGAAVEQFRTHHRAPRQPADQHRCTRSRACSSPARRARPASIAAGAPGIRRFRRRVAQRRPARIRCSRPPQRKPPRSPATLAANATMIDVLLVSMPFGPLFSPSLGLSLLQPQVVSARPDLPHRLLHAARSPSGSARRCTRKITSQHRAMSRAFVGEWIFSHALFDWDAAHDERYLADVLLKPPSWLGRNPTRPPAPGEIRAILEARDAARAFVDWCADRVVEAAAADRRLHQRLSAASRLAGAGQAAQGAAARTPSSSWAAPTAKATMGVETVRQFPFVDAVVSGEGDRVFAELVARVLAGRRARPRSAGRDHAGGGRRVGRRRHAPTAPGGRAISTRCPIPTSTTSSSSSRAAASAREWQPSVFVRDLARLLVGRAACTARSAASTARP